MSKQTRKTKTTHAQVVNVSKKQNNSRVVPTVDEILEGVNLKRNRFGEIYFIDSGTIANAVNLTQKLVLQEYGAKYTGGYGAAGIWKIEK